MSEQQPRYFEQLSSNDQKSYRFLQSQFLSKSCRNNRNQRVEKFNEILSLIKNFCIQSQNPENDNIRCMVCGLYWLPQGSLAINIRQLHILIDKCKSSINGSLQRMGYHMVTNQTEALRNLSHCLPQIQNYQEIREWSVREIGVQTPQPEPLPSDILQPESISHASLTPNPVPLPVFNSSSFTLPETSYTDSLPASPIQNDFPVHDILYTDPFSCPPSFLFGNQDDSSFFNNI